MKRNYTDAHLATLEFDETALAWHWVKMSIPAWNGYIGACEVNADEVCEYLNALQRARWDLDMPRFTVARVNLDRLAQLCSDDQEGV